MRPTTGSALLLAASVVLIPSSVAAQWLPPPSYPYPPIGAWDDIRGSIRIEVDQKEAEVFVDGYHAGIVDDFDGMFQRLHVSTGGHQIVVWLPGFRSIKEDVYLRPDQTYHLRRTMEPLGPGDPEEPKPAPIAPPGLAGAGQYPPMPEPPGARRSPAEPRQPSERPEGGVLVIRAQPAAAEILIDNEPWRGPEGDERLVIQLPAGMHHVEIRKDGFKTFTTDISIGREETVPLNVSLSPD